MLTEAVDLFKIPDVDEPFWKGFIEVGLQNKSLAWSEISINFALAEWIWLLQRTSEARDSSPPTSKLAIWCLSVSSPRSAFHPGVSLHVAPDYSRFVHILSFKTLKNYYYHTKNMWWYVFVHTDTIIHKKKYRQKLWMSPWPNSCNLICLTEWGLVITNAECHFQFQTLHSVTHTDRKQGY